MTLQTTSFRPSDVGIVDGGSLDVYLGVVANGCTTTWGFVDGLSLVPATPISADDDDFSSTPIPASSGGSTLTVFADDTLAGTSFANSDIIPSILNNGGLVGVSINADGTISVPAASTPGTYSISYQICEADDPPNCDTATVALTVANLSDHDDAPASFLAARHLVDANLRLGATNTIDTGSVSDDSDAGDDGVASFPELDTDDSGYALTVSVLNTTGGTATLHGWLDYDESGTFEVGEHASAFVNNGDTTATLAWTGYTGRSAGTAQIRLRLTSDAIGAGNPDGAASNGEVEDYAIPVVNSILASDDDFSSEPVTSAAGGATSSSVFADDRINGASFVGSAVTVSVTADGGLTGVSINSDGTVQIPASAVPGTYDVTYQICEAGVTPPNCDDAVVRVVVAPNPISAIAETFPSVNGADGGATTSVLGSDTMNGVAVDPADVTITSFTADPAVSFDDATGVITVPAGTPAGSYSVEYTVCEDTNPTNCATVTETVTVTAPAIAAVAEVFPSVNGADGGATTTVLGSDTLNGSLVDPADVTITSFTADPAVSFDDTTGVITVPAGTPAGSYSVAFIVCENTSATAAIA
ncbi:MAG: GEVED domain-containing protein, partial [Pseudomonadota bacterium]